MDYQVVEDYGTASSRKLIIAVEVAVVQRHCSNDVDERLARACLGQCSLAFERRGKSFHMLAYPFAAI